VSEWSDASESESESETQLGTSLQGVTISRIWVTALRNQDVWRSTNQRDRPEVVQT
jgi:hypothetical protein